MTEFNVLYNTMSKTFTVKIITIYIHANIVQWRNQESTTIVQKSINVQYEIRRFGIYNIKQIKGNSLSPLDDTVKALAPSRNSTN